jgi:hypothetical protein
MPLLDPTPPDPIAVHSSSLATVAYDDQRAILQVEFRDGAAYQYAAVPRRIYQDLLRADSKGAYFNHHIRGLFPYSMLHCAPLHPAGSNHGLPMGHNFAGS